jgi:hypothetical protein
LDALPCRVVWTSLGCHVYWNALFTQGKSLLGAF